MEMRDLLEKMIKFAGEKVGQKPGDQWRGSDKAPPGKKLVGDSILKDLSKGKTPKTKEQELSEEFQAFLEAEFKDTVDKRPGRKSDRHPRGHEPEPRYKTIKTDEAVGQAYTVVIDRKGREKPVTGTMEELLDYFGYTLEVGKSYEHEKGRYKINMAPKNVQQLVDALNKAKSNAAANGHSDTYYSVGQGQVAEGVPYKATNPYPALQDPIIAKVVKQMRPGLGLVGLDMANEAFLYYAYELGKQRARDGWEDYYPAIRQAYMMDKSKRAKELDEGWESGPEEYKEPYDDADDAYDRRRQEKIDTEAEREWAKLPKVSTYKLIGRGPNMEPNYAFGDTEYDTLEQAIEARKQLMADPETPHPEHIGIQTLTRVVDKQQTNEAVYTAPQNKEQYDAKMAALQDLQNDPNTANDKELQKKIIIYMDNLQKIAHQKGWLSQPVESRGHKIVATKLKDIERSKNFRVPSAEERKELAQRMKDFEAQLKSVKSKKQKVDELLNTTPYGQPAQDPKQAASVAQATQTIKAATGSAAPTTNIAKAIDAASQGKPVGQADMKVLEPVMKDVATIAQDPKLASQFKTLAQQVNQTQLKQQQLAKK